MSIIKVKSKKQKKVKTAKELVMEKMKFEIAEELGLAERVNDGGWSNLTAQETGRIGGILNSRMKNRNNKKS